MQNQAFFVTLWPTQHLKPRAWAGILPNLFLNRKRKFQGVIFRQTEKLNIATMICLLKFEQCEDINRK